MAYNPNAVGEASSPRSRVNAGGNPYPTPRPNEPGFQSRGGNGSMFVQRNDSNDVVHGSVLGEKARLLKLCLVGKIFGNTVSLKKIFRGCRRNWRRNIAGTVTLTEMANNWMSLEFDVEEDLEYVLANRPWLIKKRIFHLRRWRPGFHPRYASIDSLVVWVRLPDLPMHYWNEEAILPVVEKVGRFIKLDKRTEQKKSYVDARVCVEINLTTPLKRVVMVSDEHDVDVMRVWVSYEHLFVICFECGSHKHKLWRCPIRYPEQHFVMVDRAESDDEMEPIHVEVDPAIKEMINENVMLYFPQHGRGEKPHDDGRIEEREEEITKYLVMGNSSERVIQARNEEDDGCCEEARKQLIMKGNTINNKKRNRDSMEGNNKAGQQPKDGGSDQSVANYAGRM